MTTIRDEEQVLMRVMLGERDRCDSGPHRGKPLYEAILMRLREEGFQGATVVRGIAGFGATSIIHTGKLLRLSMDLPVIVEVVDREERIKGFLPELEAVMQGGIVTMERARVIHYGPGGDLPDEDSPPSAREDAPAGG